MEKRISLSKKLRFLVIVPILITSIVGIIIASVLLSNSGRNAIENKSTAILSRMEAVREFTANSGNMQAEIEKQQIEHPDGIINVTERERIMNLVPIIASWKIGEKNASNENYVFRIASANPRNSKNQATAKELEFLKQFETKSETQLTYKDKETNTYWIMRPVYLNESQGCLKCHGEASLSPWGNGKDVLGYNMEGFKDGEMRGMFIIKSDLKPVQKQITTAILTTVGITLIIMLIAIFISSIIIKNITTTFNEIKIATQKISEGDLQHNINISTNDELGDIAYNTNNMILSLNTILQNVSHAVENLDNASKEISTSSESISKGAQVQAAHFEELSSSVQTTSESASLANDVTNKTAISANEAGKNMKSVLDYMLNIEKNSKEITEAINLISEIAFKTNLLSINAGIEAARAGEQGKGFAVVANEIRKLADISSESAKKIEEVVLNNNKEIKDGVKITKSASLQILEIVENINKTAQELQSISFASKEQSQSMDETTNIITANAASAEELSAAAQSLANEASELYELVHKFKLKN